MPVGIVAPELLSFPILKPLIISILQSRRDVEKTDQQYDKVWQSPLSHCHSTVIHILHNILEFSILIRVFLGLVWLRMRNSIRCAFFTLVGSPINL